MKITNEKIDDWRFRSSSNQLTRRQTCLLHFRYRDPDSFRASVEAYALGFNPHDLTSMELDLILMLLMDGRVSPAYIRTLIKSQHYQKVIPLPEPDDFDLIKDSSLKKRTVKRLRAAGIETVEELLQKVKRSGWNGLIYEGLGTGSIHELKNWMRTKNIPFPD